VLPIAKAEDAVNFAASTVNIQFDHRDWPQEGARLSVKNVSFVIHHE